jgi:hypothetical protein
MAVPSVAAAPSKTGVAKLRVARMPFSLHQFTQAVAPESVHLANVGAEVMLAR